MVSIIAAIAENRVIGNKNKLPWHMPADFKWFKEKTSGKVLILGLNTFKSIGEKPLPGRKHVILTKDKNYKVPENCYRATSVEESMEVAKRLAKEQNQKEIMICGGQSVYEQFLPLADKLYLTYIHHNFKGDAYFPEFNKDEWREVNREDHQPDPRNKYPYSFVVLEKILKNKRR